MSYLPNGMLLSHNNISILIFNLLNLNNGTRITRMPEQQKILITSTTFTFYFWVILHRRVQVMTSCFVKRRLEEDTGRDSVSRSVLSGLFMVQTALKLATSKANVLSPVYLSVTENFYQSVVLYHHGVPGFSSYIKVNIGKKV